MSADVFLGVPFNIASYALLTYMVAQECNMVADEFIWTGGDCHIYKNHIEQVNLQLTREPKSLPLLYLSPGVKRVVDFQYHDISVLAYDPHPAIKGTVSV